MVIPLLKSTEYDCGISQHGEIVNYNIAQHGEIKKLNNMM